MCRHHRVFSERDRVRFGHLPVGTLFLHRGAKWLKEESVSGEVVVAVRLPLRNASISLDPRRRVTVTRASGIAKMTATAKSTVVEAMNPVEA